MGANSLPTTITPATLPELVAAARAAEHLDLNMLKVHLTGSGRISTSTIYKLMREGLPRPVKLGKGRVAWIRSEVDAYMASQAAQRSA